MMLAGIMFVILFEYAHHEKGIPSLEGGFREMSFGALIRLLGSAL